MTATYCGDIRDSHGYVLSLGKLMRSGSDKLTEAEMQEITLRVVRGAPGVFSDDELVDHLDAASKAALVDAYKMTIVQQVECGKLIMKYKDGAYNYYPA